MFSVSLVILFALILIFGGYLTGHVETIPYSEFLKHIDRGEVTSLVLSDGTITGELKVDGQHPAKPFATIAPPDDTLVHRLYERGVMFRSEPKNPLWMFIASWVLPALLFYFLWTLASGSLTRAAGGVLSMSKSRAKVYMEKEVKTTFADVAGIDEAREELQEVVSFLQNPKRYTRIGGRAPKGVLLVGPPGTGKTLLARAVAGEAHVPFFSINGSEFVEMFVGLGAARVRDLFNQARSQAPCILFIDEIDALGKSRAFGLSGIGSNEEKEQTLNQLLAEMDGFDPSEGVIMLAATNRPEILDPALLRAGRFDRQILISNPDQQGRLQILRVHVKKIVVDPSVDLEKVAALTSGFSGADLANLVNEAALVATRRNGEAVKNEDFYQAIERLVAGVEKKSKLMNPKEKERIACHELGHATAALVLNLSDKVHKVSIIPRGVGALGYTLQRPTEDRYLQDEEELFNKVAVLVAGRAAEKLFFGNVSTGAADDLAKATDVARATVTQFGMSEKLGMATLEGRRSPWLQSPFDYSMKAVSEQTASEIDQEVRGLLQRAFNVATDCLNKNLVFIAEAKKELLRVETLAENEIVELWEKFGSTRQHLRVGPKPLTSR